MGNMRGIGMANGRSVGSRDCEVDRGNKQGIAIEIEAVQIYLVRRKNGEKIFQEKTR